MVIALEREGVSCLLDPSLGGALLSLTVDGADILRHSPSPTSDVLTTACFPLVPFANRIDRGEMRVRDQLLQLPADEAALPHAHHGHGWRRSWTATASSRSEATVGLLHEPDAWPWRYRAEQTVVLGRRGIEIILTVTNLSPDPMPAGLGLHPFFPRSPAGWIETTAERILENGADGIPLREQPFQPGRKAIDEFKGMDNLLLDRSGQLKLGLGEVTCCLRAQNAIGFHVYVPAGQTFFCAEPVSHVPNAFAANAHDHLLGSGQTRRMAMVLTVDDCQQDAPVF